MDAIITDISQPKKTVTTEKAFDMLPSVAVLYDKLDIDNYRKKLVEKNKGKKDVDAQSVGIELFKYILKYSGKVKEEVFEIVATFEEKTVEEVKAQSPARTFVVLKELFQDEETMDFLKQAMK